MLNLESPVLARFTKKDERGCRAITDWVMKRQRQYGNVFPFPSGRLGTAVKVKRAFTPHLADFGGQSKLKLRQEAVDSATKPSRISTPRHPLPDLPKGLSWPMDFDKADEFGRHPKAPGGVAAYLDREWKKIIAAKKIDMPTLWEHFPWAARAINTYTKPHPKTGERRVLPPELTIPTYPQVNTQKLERVKAGEEVITDFRELNRLSSVALWRAKHWPDANPS